MWILRLDPVPVAVAALTHRNNNETNAGSSTYISITHYVMEIFNLFLAPIGAQGVTIWVRPFVRLVQTCLEQSIFIFLGQRAIKEHWEHSVIHQRAIKALKSESYSRSLKYCVLFLGCGQLSYLGLDPIDHCLVFFLQVNWGHTFSWQVSD